MPPISRLPLFSAILLLFTRAGWTAGPPTPAVVVGDGHCLALTVAGLVYDWGRDDFGQLGQGGTPSKTWGGLTSPVAVAAPAAGPWLKIGVGDNHSLAIATDGSLWGWGRNDLGQLGYSPVLGLLGISSSRQDSSPVRIGRDTDWAAVSGGMLFSIGLKRDGSLWGWGGNWTGQLGDGEVRQLHQLTLPPNKVPRRTRPARIGTDTDWSAIATGAEHVLALKKDGTLWAWGNNDCGQLGIGNFVSTNRPARIGQDRDWVAFAAGGAGQFGAQSAAIKRDGSLWAWGNWQGRALSSSNNGVIKSNLVSRPTRLGDATNWVRLACGVNHGVALRNDGTLWIWGAKAFAPEMTARHTPDLLAQVSSETNWVAAALGGRGLGGQEMLQALASDGTVWSWDPSVIGGGPIGGALTTASPATRTVPHPILWLGAPVPIAAKPTHEPGGRQ